ncbi:hypothetical protein ACPUVO_04675 [Pseudocolwellia sp. HL-MZ19]|uniref:hypothetical protein n=1 Tax=Pseudocolwellia sp. HL-MZ19 TaxID=3400846 RepID=UPI003CE8E8A5
MKNKTLPLLLLCFIQGCTALGMIVEGALPQKNDNRRNLSAIGLQADIEIVDSIIYDEPLTKVEPKVVTGCETLKGNKKTECYEGANQINKSLQKYTKQ